MTNDPYKNLEEVCAEFQDESTMIEFTLEEVKAMYRIIKDEWINRDDEEAMKVADKISKIAKSEGE